jgi:phosphatidylglycerol:prolipoprotein diacylglycerol transferase
MLMYPHIDPVALSFGPIKVHWYGIMYILGFLFFIYAGKWRIKKYHSQFWTAKLVDDFIFYGAIGVILGGRIGYCLFYQPQFFLANPLSIFKVWNGGMSFHGGILGVVIVIGLFAYKHRQNFFIIADFCALLTPAGLFFGRVGNFINGELWGRITTTNLPWAMIFPQSGTMLPRHPSQIYEMLGEGVILITILWIFATKPRRNGQISGLFLFCYGIIRFIIEYFREPDAYLLAFANNTGFSMGQWLCIPMILIGLLIFVLSSRSNVTIKSI